MLLQYRRWDMRIWQITQSGRIRGFHLSLLWVLCVFVAPLSAEDYFFHRAWNCIHDKKNSVKSPFLNCNIVIFPFLQFDMHASVETGLVVNLETSDCGCKYEKGTKCVCCVNELAWFPLLRMNENNWRNYCSFHLWHGKMPFRLQPCSIEGDGLVFCFGIW